MISKNSNNIVWVLIDRFARLITSFFIGLYVARHLGPESFGFLAIALSIAAILSSISSLSIDELLVRDLSINGISQNEILGTGLFLKLFSSICVSIVVVCYLYYAAELSTLGLIITVLVCSQIFRSFSVISCIFQARTESKLLAFVTITQLTITSIANIILVQANGEVTAFVWVYFIDALAFCIGLIFVYRSQTLKIIKWEDNCSLAKQYIKECLPLVGAGLMVIVYLKMDILMISTLIGNEASGIYAASTRLSETWFMVPMAICTATFPAIMAVRERSFQEYRNKVRVLMASLCWLSILTSLIVTFFSETIVEITYGGEYSSTAQIIAIQIWAGVFVSLGLVAGRWEIMDGNTNTTLYRTSGGAIINLILNAILIPKYGCNGAGFRYSIRTAIHELFL